MTDKELFDVLFDRIGNAAASPDDAWIAETAGLMYKAPLWMDAEPVTFHEGFPFFTFYFPGQVQKPQFSTVETVLNWVIGSHIGLSFFAPSGARWWNISHGGALSWRLYGTPRARRFFDAPYDTEWKETLSAPEQVWQGVPNEQMAPPLVRESVKWAMQEHLHISEPKIGLIQRESEPGISRLVFNLDPLMLGGDEAAYNAYKYLLWFVPSCIPTIHVPTMVGNGDWMAPL